MTPERAAEIAQCGVMAALVSPSYIAAPASREDLAEAKRLGKPVIALLLADVEVPEGFLPEGSICHRVSGPEEANAFIRAELALHYGDTRALTDRITVIARAVDR